MSTFVIVKSRNPNERNVQVRMLDMSTEAVVSERMLTDAEAYEFNVDNAHALLIVGVDKPEQPAPVASPIEEPKRSFLAGLFGWRK